MPKVACILGAGASKESGCPVMADFLDTARVLSDRIPDLRKDYFQVTKARDMLLRSAHRVAHTREQLNNLETLYSCLELGEITGWGLDFSTRDVRQARESLVRLIADTLDHSQDLNLRSFGDGPSGNFKPGGPNGYRQLVNFAGHFYKADPSYRFDYISFNYDIGLEVALAVNGFDYDYCLSGPEYAGSSSEPRCLVLKLHGSVNWAASDSSITALSGKRFAPYEAICSEFLHKSPSERPRDSDPVRLLSSRHRVGSLPFIVPPSDSKGHRRATLSPVWKEAARVLREAEILIFVGYSMPQTDGFFRELCRISSIGASDTRKVIVINISNAAHENVRSLLSPSIHSTIETSFGTCGMTEALDKLTKSLQDCPATRW